VRRDLGQGTKDGKPRQVYIYQVADNETCMQKHGVQAVVWQTGVNPVIAMELLETGVWQAKACWGRKPLTPTRSWTRWPSTTVPTASRKCDNQLTNQLTHQQEVFQCVALQAKSYTST